MDSVYTMLDLLHNANENSVRNEASTWLGQLQISDYAWDVGVRFLQENRSVLSAFFAAQTLKTKIEYSFCALSSEEQIYIRNCIVNQLKAKDLDVVVVRRLCLSLVALIFRLPAWSSPVEDLIKEFYPSTIIPLLEMFNSLCLETYSYEPRTSEEETRIIQIKTYLKQIAPTVIQLLDAMLVHNQVPQIALFKCLASWVTHYTVKDLVCTRVFEHSFTTLLAVEDVPDDIDAASSLILSTVEALADSNVLKEVGVSVFEKLMSLQEAYHMSVALEDHHKVLTFSKLFTEVGQYFIVDILSKIRGGEQHYALPIMDLILQCSGHHDYEVAEQTFGFWTLFGENMLDSTDAVVHIVRPYAERLIVALCNNCQMEPDQVGLLSKYEEFYEFRERSADLVEEVVHVCGANRCFLQLMEQQLLQAGASWEVYEAILFIMTAVSRKVTRFDPGILDYVWGNVMNFCYKHLHVAIRHTQIQLIGRLALVMYENYMARVVHHLVKSLQDPNLASQAALSLQMACQHAAPEVAKCHTAICHLSDYFNFTPKHLDCIEQVDLLKHFGLVLKHLPVSERRPIFDRLLNPSYKKLLQTLEDDSESLTWTSEPIRNVVRISTLITFCTFAREGDGHEEFIYKVVPVLLQLCSKLKDRKTFVEFCCVMLRDAIVNSCLYSMTLVQPIETMYTNIFGEYPYRGLLKLAGQIIEFFIENPPCLSHMTRLLRIVFQPIVRHIEMGCDHFVDQMFTIITAFFTHSPGYLIGSNFFLKEIILVAAVALGPCRVTLDVKRNVARFLTEVSRHFVVNVDSRQYLDLLVQSNSEAILRGFFYAAHNDKRIILLASDVIFTLKCLNDSFATCYLKEGIAALPDTFGQLVDASLLTAGVQDYFYQEFLRAENVLCLSDVLTRMLTLIYQPRCQHVHDTCAWNFNESP